MCKRNLLIAMVVSLPVWAWADITHPSVSITGLPTTSLLNSTTSGINSNVQVAGVTSDSGTNVSSVVVTSSQTSYSGTGGSLQTENSNLNVEYSGTGFVQVTEGNSLVAGLPITSTLGLGLGTTTSSTLGLGLGTTSLGFLGVGSSLNTGLMGTRMSLFIGQPVMTQLLLQ